MNTPLLTLTIRNVKLSKIYPIIKHYCAEEPLSSLNRKISSNNPLLECAYTEDSDLFSEFVQIVDELDKDKYEIIVREVFSDGTSREIDVDIVHNLLDSHNDTAEYVSRIMDLEIGGEK